jgi:hypothetical protein
MGTSLAGRIEEVLSLQDDLEPIPLYINVIAFLTGLKNFSFYGSTHFSPVHHPLTRDSDHEDLTGLKSFFQRKGDDRTGIASLHDKSQLEPTEFVKVGGQIVFTEGVPDQTIDFFGASNEPGCHAKGEGPFSEPDDKIDGLLNKEVLRYFSDFLLNHIAETSSESFVRLPAGRRGVRRFYFEHSIS